MREARASAHVSRATRDVRETMGGTRATVHRFLPQYAYLFNAIIAKPDTTLKINVVTIFGAISLGLLSKGTVTVLLSALDQQLIMSL